MCGERGRDGLLGEDGVDGEEQGNRRHRAFVLRPHASQAPVQAQDGQPAHEQRFCAGIAGLSAAWELRRRGFTDVIILELDDEIRLAIALLITGDEITRLSIVIARYLLMLRLV